MERLTNHDHKEMGSCAYVGEQNPYEVPLTIGELAAPVSDGYSPRAILKEVFGRLAAYEDTGMMPERVAELAQAERDGRLVMLSPDGWLIKILEERDRQDQKWGFPQENTYCEWASILAEEVGELAKELNELNFGRGDIERMEAEAVQVAAVALAILEQSDVALRVTEQVAKALRRVPARPKCFYGDTDLCRGMSVNNDDEPIEACKRCRWCSAGYQRLETEAAVDHAEGD